VCTSSFLCAHCVVLRENDLFHVACIRMIKCSTKKSFFRDTVFVFLYNPQKISVFHENVCEHIEYVNIHPHFLSNFFIFKFYFAGKGSICS
jgi:hypothetical protein